MSHSALITRIQGEYLEMPGLRLTLEQAQRLCGVERMLCRTVLDALVEAKFLFRTPDGQYARLTTGRHPHPAKADIRTGIRSLKAS
jgi:hypothetical protein